MRSTTRPRIAGLQIRHSLAIELSSERADPGTRKSHINERGLTVHLVDAKQKAKRFGGILVCAHDEPEGRICMVGHRETETCISAEYWRFSLHSEGENALASGSSFV